MAGNAVEIERLRRELAETNRRIRELEESYGVRLEQEIAVIRDEFAQSLAVQQEDVSGRFQELEQSMCDAYLREVEDMRARYEELEAAARDQEEQLNRQIHELEQEQAEFFRQRAASKRKLEDVACRNLERLRRFVESACSYPVDRFFPHTLQRYIDAGQEAQQLMERGLFSLAAAKADVARMAVERLESDTAAKVLELELMFRRYQEKLLSIRRDLASDSYRRLLDDSGNVILQLSETDVDYWSDQLYDQLLQSLERHQRNVDGGVDGWLEQNAGEEIPVVLALDREMQRLDSIPQKLRICVSYALSACDCYNYSAQVRDLAEELLREQNYTFSEVSFGACKDGNNSSAGYRDYARSYLCKAVCFQPGGNADFREERRITFTKRYGSGGWDVCSIILVPRRSYDAVSMDMFLKLESDYLPDIVQDRLIWMFQEHGLRLRPLEQPAQAATDPDRPLNLGAVEQFYGVPRERELTAKYSYSVSSPILTPGQTPIVKQ